MAANFTNGQGSNSKEGGTRYLSILSIPCVTLTYLIMKTKILLVVLTAFSGCAIIPTRNTLTLDKTIELDKRGVEELDVGIRLEWIR
jgi:uncharacterized protein YceK